MWKFKKDRLLASEKLLYKKCICMSREKELSSNGKSQKIMHNTLLYLFPRKTISYLVGLGWSVLYSKIANAYFHFSSCIGGTQKQLNLNLSRIAECTRIYWPGDRRIMSKDTISVPNEINFTNSICKITIAEEWN